MYTSLRAFNGGLYEEHLEEISFLYEQRRALTVQPRAAWRDLARFEARLEAHVDALLVGRDHALEVCRQVSKTGDFGQLFGALTVFCRTRQESPFARTLNELDHSNRKKVEAAADAMKFELPTEWSPFMKLALQRSEAPLTPVLAVVAGYRRLQSTARAIYDALPRQPESAALMLESLGKLRARDAWRALESHLSHPETKVREAALIAMLRCGRFEAVDVAAQQVSSAAWPWIPLALSGGRSVGDSLLAALDSKSCCPEALLALGLLGDTKMLRSLFNKLDDAALADSAAQAMQWITGAEMDIETFVPEEVEEALLFKKELQAWRQYKQAPARLSGQPFGELIRKLCTDKEAWSRWLSAHLPKFDSRLRYRNGKPLSPGSLLLDLQSEHSSSELRYYSALELEIRYACDVALEVDMPVQLQIQALGRLAAWVRSNAESFVPGRWYFDGREL